MAEVLDGVLTLGGSGPVVTYPTTTSVNVAGDGVDTFNLMFPSASKFIGALYFLDTNAAQPQVFEFEMTVVVAPAGNSRPFIVGFLDTVTADTAGAGVGMTFRAPPEWDTIATGGNGTFTMPTTSVKFYYRYTFDPTANTCTLQMFSDAARTTQVWTSGAADCSGGDGIATGQLYLEMVGHAARSAEAFEFLIENVNFDPVAGPPTEIREVFKDKAGTVYPDGTVVHVYNADGTLAYSGTVGTSFGADPTHTSVAAITAGTGVVSVTFGNGDLAVRSIDVDAAKDADGLKTNNITPTQLV